MVDDTVYDEVMLKAEIAIDLQLAVDEMHLTPAQAAEYYGVPLSFIEKMDQGELDDLSLDELRAARARLLGVKEESLKQLVGEGVSAADAGDFSKKSVSQIVDDVIRKAGD
ncbi:helix-turn-helix domain-containing protein [Mesorhizobium sp. A623]